MRVALPKICVAAVVLALSGCSLISTSSTQPVSLQTALVQTVDALSAAHAEVETEGVVGYYPCTLSASFNVASATSVGGSLAQSASSSTDSIVSELSGSHSSSQGNQVTVLLASPMCAPSVALGRTQGERQLENPAAAGSHNRPAYGPCATGLIMI
jgi:hypothetical protein